MQRYICSPGLLFILFCHFCSFMMVWGLGIWGWGLGFGFWGRGFQLMGFGVCGEGPSGFFLGVRDLYKHGLNPGKKLMQQVRKRRKR